MIEIRKGDSGHYYFQLITPEGSSLLTSIEFSNREELNGIVSRLHTMAQDPLVFERKTTHHGQFLFEMKSPEGRSLGKSQLYNSEAGMENGIKNLRRCIASLDEQSGS